ncbi:hypothetical protein [Litchfieldia alkalitelluris]|uniref:hypothetical protein n=1 Tax=Litchfieldia alkalitelluris TaxID=304268 RepID=UPI000998D088|nr:hypothetical protein [Litchfieldia alkalitelluris]
MIGDQIYADDVAIPLAPFLYKLGEHLIGKVENLIEVDQHVENYLATINQINGRKKMVEDLCKFLLEKEKIISLEWANMRRCI